jgi:MFS family permease
MRNNKNISENELKRSLNLVILGVTFGICFFVFINGAPLTGFIRALGVSDFMYGIIMAMPVVGNVVQVFASYYLEASGKRKSLFVVSGFFHRLIWIPIAIIPLVVPISHNSIRIWSISILIAMFSMGNAVSAVSFWSWMGGLVPSEIKGRFFSKRTMICTISSTIAGLIIGKLLGSNPDFERFAIIIIMVVLFGVSDIFCFIWVKDPPMNISKEKTPFFKLFFEPFKNRNYMKFILFIVIWNFGVNFTGPFFNVYMLEYLNMSFFMMAIFAQLAGSVATIFFIRSLGSLVDKYGNKPILSICCTVAVFLPLLWLLATPQNYYIVIVISFISGICWPGIELTSLNLSIWLAPEKNRSIYIANFALITSIFGTIFAFICGGAFMQISKPFFDSLNINLFLSQKLSAFHVMFVITASIRLLALVIFQPRIKEDNAYTVRDVLRDMFSLFDKIGVNTTKR